MKKRIFSLLLAITVCSMMGATPAVAYGLEETAERSVSQTIESKSEYEMAIEETQRMEACAKANTQSGNDGSVHAKTPLEEYKEAFDVRAEVDTETLSGMGYSSAEIDILQK